jgi:hypothetical protein
MNNNEGLNKFERFKDYCQNHRLISVLIIIGFIVWALGSFTEKLDGIIEFAHKHWPSASKELQKQPVTVSNEQAPPVEVTLTPKTVATEIFEAKSGPAPNPDATSDKVAIKLPEETKVAVAEPAAAQPGAQSAEFIPVTPPKPTLKTHGELIAEIEANIQAAQEQGIDPNKVLTADEAYLHNVELMKKPVIITTGTEIQIGAIPKPPVDQIGSNGGTPGKYPPGIKETETVGSAIATNDIGSLRVIFKSVMPVKLTGRNGQNTNGIRCSFEFISRETQRPIFVAMNATNERKGSYNTTYDSSVGTYGDCGLGVGLRSSLVDSHGDLWSYSSVTGVSIIGVGCAIKDHDPSEIVSMLEKQDQLDGASLPMNAQYVYGSPSPINPRQTVSVMMTFILNASTPEPRGYPEFFQISSEVVVGIVTTGTKKSYSLNNLTFDRVSMPAGGR